MKIPIEYLISICFILLLLFTSSFIVFDANAQQGGAATGGAAQLNQGTGMTITCTVINSCIITGNSATGGSGIGGKAVGSGDDQQGKQSQIPSSTGSRFVNNNSVTPSSPSTLGGPASCYVTCNFYGPPATAGNAINPGGRGGQSQIYSNSGNNSHSPSVTSDTKSLIDKGITLYALGNYNEAITYYDKALAIDPDQKNALLNKGYALSKLGRYSEAITYYDKILAIDPNYGIALYLKDATIEKLNNGNR
jgi:tetratricopeptide (TPR) repeat protein